MNGADYWIIRRWLMVTSQELRGELLTHSLD